MRGGVVRTLALWALLALAPFAASAAPATPVSQTPANVLQGGTPPPADIPLWGLWLLGEIRASEARMLAEIREVRELAEEARDEAREANFKADEALRLAAEAASKADEAHWAVINWVSWGVGILTTIIFGCFGVIGWLGSMTVKRFLAEIHALYALNSKAPTTPPEKPIQLKGAAKPPCSSSTDTPSE